MYVYLRYIQKYCTVLYYYGLGFPMSASGSGLNELLTEIN
jgi:hypothetical protein